MDKGIEKHGVTRPAKKNSAAGDPGEKPTWNSGAKTLVGTAASSRSRIWYTIGRGTLNEIYFPDVDQANTRSMRFLISDGKKFFSDEAWDAEHQVQWMEPGVPGVRIESRCKSGRYRLSKEILSDPIRDTLIMRVQFTPLDSSDLKLFLYVNAHVGDRGKENSAWVGDYKGMTMLFAKRASLCVAAVLSSPPLQTSCGYVGNSDGYTRLSRLKALSKSNTAEDGNVALTAEVDYKATEDGVFRVALAGGSDGAEAGQQARAGILQNFPTVKDLFVRKWKDEQGKYREVEDLSGHALDMYRVSTAVLETHQSKRFPGAFVASLSMPWGFARSDKDIGGYHVLWPRDLCETAMGKLASGDAQSARSALFYLRCTQEASGGWSQNMWLDGTPHWDAIQMDGIALTVLLADQLRRENSLDNYDPTPMIKQTVRFLLKHGPVTQQGRWEAVGGYSPYTIATEVASLLAAADFIEGDGDPVGAAFLRETADAWHDCIDEFTYVTGTALAEEHGVSGYYVRIAPHARIEKAEMGSLRILMPNRPFGSKHQHAAEIISPDAFELVRFGMRAANDPRMVATAKVVDATLKYETTTGPVWKRSTKDGYGEKADGAPFKKTGVGRGWPLLAGERGHYEIAAGNHDYALELLKTMARQTSECGMIPEQVWDAPDIPKRFLFNGHPAGSGMPLVWAHAEYIKLLRSLHSGSVWDLPPQPVQRYQVANHVASFQIWTPKQKRGWLAQGKELRLDLPAPATVRWATGRESAKVRTEDRGFGIHCALIPTSQLPMTSKLRLTITPDEPDESFKAQNATVQIQAPIRFTP